MMESVPVTPGNRGSPAGDVERASLLGNETPRSGYNIPGNFEERILHNETPARGRARTSTGNSCWKRIPLSSWITFALFVMLLIGMTLLKVESDQRYDCMRNQVQYLQQQLDQVENSNKANTAALQNKLDQQITKDTTFQSNVAANFNTVSTVIQTQNTSVQQRFHSVLSHLSDHDATLIKLTNGTSNAEVLDKLKLTKQQVAEQMSTAKLEVTQQLQTVSHNMTKQMEVTHAKMQAIEENIQVNLDQTVKDMEVVVTQATDHIHEVQRNVSTQMDTIRMKVTMTIHDLEDSVSKAQDLIQDEVSVVKNNIDQYVAVTNKQFAAENDFVKYQLAGTLSSSHTSSVLINYVVGFFTLLSCLIFLWHLTSHTRHVYRPEVQKRIMAILWMVPIYSITSWLSMMRPSWEPTLATARDCYEAYVVYTFVAMLVAILGDGRSLDELEVLLSERIVEEREQIEDYQRRVRAPTDVESSGSVRQKLGPPPKEHFHPPYPCCYDRSSPLSVAKNWLWQCRILALQFMFIKPLVTVVPLILSVSGAYNIDSIPPWQHNTVNWHSPKLYIVIIQNLSVGLAFYGLLSFYHGTEKDLAWCEPWPKFLCIKGIVFATFWQSLCIQLMSAFDLVDEKAASQIQNLLICVEMLIATIAHYYIFPYHEWHPDYKKKQERTLLMIETMGFMEFVQDTKSLLAPRRRPAAGVSNNTAESVDSANDKDNDNGGEGGIAMPSLSTRSANTSRDHESTGGDRDEPLEGDPLLSPTSQIPSYDMDVTQDEYEFARLQLERRLHQLEATASKESGSQDSPERYFHDVGDNVSHTTAAHDYEEEEEAKSPLLELNRYYQGSSSSSVAASGLKAVSFDVKSNRQSFQAAHSQIPTQKAGVSTSSSSSSHRASHEQQQQQQHWAESLEHSPIAPTSLDQGRNTVNHLYEDMMQEDHFATPPTGEDHHIMSPAHATGGHSQSTSSNSSETVIVPTADEQEGHSGTPFEEIFGEQESV